MVARIALTPITAVRGGGVALGVGTSAAVASTGMIVNGPVGAFHLELQVANGTSSPVNVIIRASGYQGTPGQAANSGYLTDQYQPYAAASAGDLVVAVAANATVLITDLDTGRFSRSPLSAAVVSRSALALRRLSPRRA